MTKDFKDNPYYGFCYPLSEANRSQMSSPIMVRHSPQEHRFKVLEFFFSIFIFWKFFSSIFLFFKNFILFCAQNRENRENRFIKLSYSEMVPRIRGQTSTERSEGGQKVNLRKASQLFRSSKWFKLRISTQLAKYQTKITYAELRVRFWVKFRPVNIMGNP